MKDDDSSTRREFLGQAGLSASLLPLAPALRSKDQASERAGESAMRQPERIDLSPAKWIWFPSQRTLPNTFVLFRRALKLDARPRRARGWITADSRYRLLVNGHYIQRGPAPCDPRWMDVDPIDIGSHLREGDNVLAIEVLYFGNGESRWIAGTPGLLFSLLLEFDRGRQERVVSNEEWLTWLDRAHRPGQYKRWFLRALQEEFDARLHPVGWEQPGFSLNDGWIPAMLLDNRADKPTLCSRYEDYLWMRSAGNPEDLFLRRREIPLLREWRVPAIRLQESARVNWMRDPVDWFEFRTPNSFRIDRRPVISSEKQGQWVLPPTLDPRTAVIATFEFKEEVVGFPYFTIEAPAGAVVELICQEGHDPSQTAWLDSHWFTWSRFICGEGVNHFETSDSDALRWLQLHVRNTSRPVTISKVGVRRRVYPCPNEAHIRCSEPALQRLFDACINNLCNSAQETSCDPGREWQQYGGAGSLQLNGVRYAFGEHRLPRRVLRTYSEGLSPDGYFLDPWPAFEVLYLLGHRQIGTSVWGSQIDEGVTFVHNCWAHYLQTGDLEGLREVYPRLLRFSYFLERVRGSDGLLPVENLGSRLLNVWLDDDAYLNQPRRLRQCAFNLHTAAMFRHALSPLAKAYGQQEESARLLNLGTDIELAAVQRFWGRKQRLFIDNLPWLDEDKVPRLSDRTLAISVLFDQCPGGDIGAAVRALVERPKEMGLSYPMNSVWRYWALARAGRIDVVLRDLRTRWATMRAVIENNSLPEVWNHQPDRRDEFNYFQVTPLNILFMDIAGIRPLSPGFARCQIRPQLGDLGALELTAYTPQGPIHFEAEPERTGHRLSLRLPIGCEGELVLPAAVPCPLPVLDRNVTRGVKRYRLQSGAMNIFWTSPQPFEL